MKRRRCTPIADDQEPGPVPGQEPGCQVLASVRPYVRHCGDSHRPAWRIGPRKLLDYLLVYIAAGSGRFTLGRETCDVEAGDLFWIPPDTVHSMEGFEPGMHCPYVHFDLIYRPEHSHWDFTIPEGFIDLSELRPLMHPPVTDPAITSLAGRIRGHTNRRVGHLIQEVCAEAARAQPFAVLRLSGLMLEALAEILRGRTGLPHDYLSHVAALESSADRMTRECATPPLLAELARHCRLSPSHFRYLFQRHFDCSPRTYIRRARLQRVKELMVGTGLSLSEIAQQVGFGTVHSLSRAFRSCEGVSPSEYRRGADIRTRVEGRRTSYVR